MRKKVYGRKLGREKTSRLALFVSLAESLIVNKSIVTTKAKAKAILPFIDKLVVLSKKGTLASKRLVLRKLRNNKEVATILWKDMATIFEKRNSGFTRIVNLPQRVGDRAELVRMEFVDKVIKKNEKDVSTKTKGN